MNIFKGFSTGITAYRQAADILFSRKFRYFLIFPVAALLLVFIGGQILTSYWGNDLARHVQTAVQNWLAGISWLHWMGEVSGFLIRLLLKVAWFMLFVAFGGYLVVVIMSPVYSWLSERTEAFLTGREYPFSFRQLLREIFQGILIALRNMFFQFFLFILFFICSFIPLVGLLSPLILFLVSAYFYGFSFVDYAIERKKFNVKESVRYVNKNVGAVIGIGGIFTLSLMIPWIGITISCFISLLSVIAGTITVNKIAQDRSL